MHKVIDVEWLISSFRCCPSRDRLEVWTRALRWPTNTLETLHSMTNSFSVNGFHYGNAKRIRAFVSEDCKLTFVIQHNWSFKMNYSFDVCNESKPTIACKLVHTSATNQNSNMHTRAHVFAWTISREKLSLGAACASTPVISCSTTALQRKILRTSAERLQQTDKLQIFTQSCDCQATQKSQRPQYHTLSTRAKIGLLWFGFCNRHDSAKCSPA